MSKGFPSRRGQVWVWCGTPRRVLYSGENAGVTAVGGGRGNPFPGCLLLGRWVLGVLMLRAPRPAGP